MPLTRRLALFAAALPAAAILAPRPAAAADLLTALKSGGKTLLVGTDATFPPFEQTSPGGVKSGFDLDLVNAVAEEIGIKKVEFRQVPFGQLIPGLIADHIDLAASAIYITPVRAKVVNFTKPYFSGGLSVMIKPGDNSITKPADLAGKRLAVQVGTKSVDFLAKQYPASHLVIVQTNDQMFQALQSGRADAVVTGYPAARYYIKTHGGAKLTGFLLTHEEYGMALRKENVALLAAIDAALDALAKNGKKAELERHWFGAAS